MACALGLPINRVPLQHFSERSAAVVTFASSISVHSFFSRGQGSGKHLIFFQAFLSQLEVCVSNCHDLEFWFLPFLKNNEDLWTFPYAECSPPLSSYLANGHVQGSGRVYRSNYNFTCNSGYVLFGDDYITCTENGTWNGTAPVCVKGNENLLITFLSERRDYIKLQRFSDLESRFWGNAPASPPLTNVETNFLIYVLYC